MPLQITILGLDALGAALGLALGTLDPDVLDVGRPVITGWDADKRAMADARGRLAADQVQADLQTAIRDADVVFVNVPQATMREVLATIATTVKPGTIVTDTATGKAEVLRWAAELLPATVEFVGGHPLVSLGADSRDARRDSLRDSIYCLVPLPRTKQNALDGVEALVRAIGAKPYYIEASEHDIYVAAAGHLPLAVSVALMDLLGQSGGWRELQPIAGEALLRMTELTEGDPEASREALLGNREAVATWLERMSAALLDLRARLDDPDALADLLDRSRQTRERWLQSEPNLRPGEDAFYGGVAEMERSSISGLFFGRRSSRERGRRR